MTNLTAFMEGRDARLRDDEEGTLTDNPYSPHTEASTDWYRGYNFDEEHPEVIQEIRSIQMTTLHIPNTTGESK